MSYGNLQVSANGVALKKVLFFLAGNTPTSNENTLLNNIFVGNVLGLCVEMRNAASDDGVSIEQCDGVMSYYPTAIPTRYAALVTAATIKSYSAMLAGGGTNLSLFAPAAVGGAFAHTATTQLCLVTVGPDSVPVEVTKTTGVTYASSNTAVATVSTTGVVTGVTAGSVTITATWAVDAHNTITATKALTLS